VGMFDHITCELPMPDGREVPKDSFQTKSFWCTMSHFTITKAGRLIYHKRHYSPASDEDSKELVHVGDIDMDYHGDIEIHGVTPDRVYVSYAIRFSHGAVEWIRAFEELPEIHQSWLVERGQ
jgi:hypothetical protein